MRLRSPFILMTKETKKISSRHQTADVLNQLRPEGIVVNLDVINEKTLSTSPLGIGEPIENFRNRPIPQLAVPLQSPNPRAQN